MKFFPVIFAVALLVSCDRRLDDDASLSISRYDVTCDAGSHLVTVRASSSWILTLYFEGEQSDWASLSVLEGSGNGSSVLRYEANESENDRSLMVILTTAAGDITQSFIQRGIPRGNDGPDDGEDPDIDPDNPTAMPGWMELPSLAGFEDLRFVTHDMTVSSIPSRNFSLLWDKSKRVAHWVAYPLNAWTIGSGSRTNAWNYDPKVPQDEQPDLSSSYSGSYDRGHQCPSADRLTYNANVQTFYYTNMTPQLGTLNQQILANFEGTVRSWAQKSDTLYVVTGCVFGSNPKYAYDKWDTPIEVPTGYFKALLRYSRNSTIGWSDYLGAAFYFEHRGYSQENVTASMSMSIDELEEMTGIDFFANLPAKIGETAAANVEAQRPSTVSWWGLN